MKIITTIHIKALLVMAMITLLGCSNEQLVSDPVVKGTKEVLFSINVPGKTSNTTRALGEAEENEVKSIEMLLFKDGKVVHMPVFADVIGPDLDNANDITKKSFSVRLPEGTFDVVIFANARKVFQDIQNSGTPIKATDDKAATLARLTVDMPATGWVADPTSATKAYLIPLWGEKTDLVVGVGSKITGFYLHRMLARVDLSVTGTALATGDFKIESIKLYNGQTKGRIAPLQSNWNVAGSTEGGTYGKASAASVAANSTAGAAIEYTGTKIAADGKSSLREIYMFEAPKATADGQITAPCILVKGKFNGVSGWYRIDFADYTKTVTAERYVDVLRNNKYDIKISKVTGTGFPTEEDALKNRGENIIVDLVVWNEFNLGNMVFDGQHFLAITPEDRTITREANPDNSISITTDNMSETITINASSDPLNPSVAIPGNWLYNVVSGSDVDSGYGYKTRPVTFKVLENKGAPRAAYIHVKVGRLTKVIRITQSDRANNFLVALNSSGNPIDALEFGALNGVDPAMKKYTVKWSSLNESLYISKAAAPNPLGGMHEDMKWISYLTTFGSNSYPGTTVYTNSIMTPTGEAEFSLQPTALTNGVDGVNLTTNPFYERQVSLLYQVTGTDGIMRKRILLQQYVYNMKSTVETYYRADGSEYTFNIKSNRPWRAFLVDAGLGQDGTSNMVTYPAVSNTTPFASGGYNLPGGTNVPFTIANDLQDLKIIKGIAKVRIEWQGSDDPDEDWIVDNSTTLLCVSGDLKPLSNTYIVKPDATPILVPVKRANGMLQGGATQANWTGGTPIGASTAFTADLVWSDVKASGDHTDLYGLDHIDGTTPIKTIETLGVGAEGYVLIKPGSQQGNAVVSVKVGTKIVWSWHIWVTGETIDKTSGSMMDRNLGAMSATVHDPGSLGMFYQWGRKDPILGTNGWSNSKKTLYNRSGTYSPASSQSGSALSNAILNPATDYSDWMGSNGDNSWNSTSNTKTLYDPCPEGWRVPSNSVFTVKGAYPGINSWYYYNKSSYYVSGTTWVTGSSSSIKGITIGSSIMKGYYPAAGISRYGSIEIVGSGACYWSATNTGTTKSLYMSFTEVGVVPSNDNSPRNHCFPVRCVAE